MEYLFLEIWRFDKPITLSLKKNTFSVTSVVDLELAELIQCRFSPIVLFGNFDLLMHPESAEIIPQGVELCFSKQNCVRNPKMGSKQSIFVPPQYYFFLNYFRHQKPIILARLSAFVKI